MRISCLYCPLHKPSLSREEETAFPSPPSLGGNLIIYVKVKKNACSPAVVTWDSVSLFGLLPLPARMRDAKSYEAIKKVVKNLAGQVMTQMIYPETNCCRGIEITMVEPYLRKK